jgi:hypothetical protein
MSQASVAQAVIVAVVVASALLFIALRIIQATRERQPSCCSGNSGCPKKKGSCDCRG